MANFGNSFITVARTWSELKTILNAKLMSLQYDDSNPDVYELFAIDGPIVYVTTIYRGTVPESVQLTYSQAQNDQDEADFENNYKSRSNMPVTLYQQGDSRWVYRFGNHVSTGSGERLVANQGYYEPSSQGQRAVKSTNANDVNPNGSGAKQVRITYLNSNYVKKVEDVFLNGTTAVATVNTDIRFIEKFEVIKGTNAVGRIILCTGSNGLGEICSIGAATTDAFLCHHYVPSGSKAEIIEWSATASDDALMRLHGRQWISGNIVDVVLDLDNLTGIASGSRLDFARTFKTLPQQEKTYVRITATPQQGTSTTVRARMNIWEDALYVSGSV
jgi:hypothetical protein